MPWSFTFKGVAISHETDDCYVIGADDRFTRNHILVIKDNLERAIMMDDNDLSDEVSKFLSGFKMILGNLTSLLDKFEVKEIDCLGLEFDPTVAEAVLTEHDENRPENVVLEVLTKGYKYKDKLIRPAMVKVNK